jgi:hypothetical protein
MIVAALVLAATAGAQARSLDNYRDLIRPHGQPRSDAVFNGNLDACYATTGASRYRSDSPAFKNCMLGRGYRWLSVQQVPEPRTRYSQPSYEPEPPPAFEPPPTMPEPPTIPGPTYDPITGQINP